ncbi:hypothetical protein [Streptomyces sp. NPDC018947]|uniref:hypothetical protein n=1 Tax=Streptomyces sp. NPDC018947 TaxID=3365054 RepID=UPI00379C1461
MTDHRLEGPGENGAPVPRDMPDQQAGAGEDPWEAASSSASENTGSTSEDTEDTAREPGTGGSGAGEPSDSEETDVPDTDEAGSGRRGAPQSGNVHPEHPVPDESSG